MDKHDVEMLKSLLETYGPEKLLVYIKGYCFRKAESVREATIPKSTFAVGYERIGNAIKSLLSGIEDGKTIFISKEGKPGDTLMFGWGTPEIRRKPKRVRK